MITCSNPEPPIQLTPASNTASVALNANSICPQNPGVTWASVDVNRIFDWAVPRAMSVPSTIIRVNCSKRTTTPGSIVSEMPAGIRTEDDTMYGLCASVHVVFVLSVPETDVCAAANGGQVR